MRNKGEIEYEEDNLDDEIDIVELLMIARRHIRLIISITLIVIAIGAAFALTRPLIYKADTMLIVSSGNYYSAKNLDDAELRRNQQLVTTYTAIAKSPAVLNKIIKKLDLDVTPIELEKKLKIEPVEDTEIIKISATDNSPVRAMQIANETANEFIVKGKEVMTFANIRIVEEAELPKIPESRKRALIVAISAVLGVFISLGLVMIIEMLHSKIKNPKDIKKILGVDILACVPVYEQLEEIGSMHEKGWINKIIKLGDIGRNKKKVGGK